MLAVDGAAARAPVLPTPPLHVHVHVHVLGELDEAGIEGRDIWIKLASGSKSPIFVGYAENAELMFVENACTPTRMRLLLQLAAALTVAADGDHMHMLYVHVS